LAAASGDMAALPAMAQTCSWSRATRLTRAATGWAAKQSFACRLGRPGLGSPLITGRLPTGSVSTTPTLILVVSAPRLSMCRELRLRSWCWPWGRMAMVICSTGTISAVLLQLWPQRTWAALTEGRPLLLTIPARERILLSITTSARLGPTELPQRVRQRL